MAVTFNPTGSADNMLSGSISSTPGGAGTVASPLAQQAPAVAADTATDGAAVNLTSRATRLADLEQSLQSGSPVSQARVQAIASALAAGTYRMDPARIAAGLAQSDGLLGQLPGLQA